MSTLSSRGARTAASALATLLLAGACTGDGESPKEPRKTGAGDTTSEVAVTSAVGTVAGTLDAPGQEAVVAKAVALVEAWWDKAYLGGDYPRADFADAFPGFTPGAAKLATADAALLSNAAVGPRIDEVEAVAKEVSVDILSPRSTPSAATARIRLEFTTTGELEQQVLVTGRLMLAVDAKGNWQIVGYDVSRSDSAPADQSTPVPTEGATP